MSTYVLPQVLIYQEFALAPTALTDPLRACPLGPQYALFRYDDPAEKALGAAIADYDSTTDESVAWPNLPAGGVVDQGYTKVFVDDARLRYHHNATLNTEVAPKPNIARFPTLVLRTTPAADRSAVFADRDVDFGDLVEISDGTVTARRQILGFKADTVASVLPDNPTPDAGNARVSTDPTAVTIISDAEQGDWTLSVQDAELYDGRAAGRLDEEYTVKLQADTEHVEISAAGETVVVPFTSGESFTHDILRGVSITLTGAGSLAFDNQEWILEAEQQYALPALDVKGTYTGPIDATYVLEITLGGDPGDAKFKVRTVPFHVDSRPESTLDIDEYTLGVYGVIAEVTGATDGFVTGDVFRIEAQAASEGAIRTAVLNEALPAALVEESATARDVSFFIKRSSIELPRERIGFGQLVNWEQSDAALTLKAGVQVYDSEWTAGGEVQPLPLYGGTVYANYRALIHQWVGQIGTIDDVGEISDVFNEAPVIHPDNPLVFGVYKALLNSNGTPVRFSAVAGDALEDWTDVLSVLTDSDTVYSLVPLTQEKQVLDAVAGHVEAMSAPEAGAWRVAWFNMPAVTEEAIYTESKIVGEEGEPVLATIDDDPEVPGTENLLVHATGQKFVTGGINIRPGDIVRAEYADDGFGNVTYNQYVVQAVLNDEEIRLVTGPDAAITTPSEIEIWRNLSRTEAANATALNPGLFSTRRVRMVWPDVVGNAGMTFPGYFLCCALAGLRSGSLPHRPLTNVEVRGFDDLSRAWEFFNRSQLNVLAAAGYWIVTQDRNDGSVFTRHQLTSDNLDLLRREDSITTNVDSISYSLHRAMAPYIGRGNVVPSLINRILGTYVSRLDYFLNFEATPLLGPQLLNYTIVEFGPHPVLSDRVRTQTVLTVPAPFNNFEARLVIDV